MTMLWTGDELMAAMGGRAVGDLPGGVGGLSIDSRTLASGELFFAIAGDRLDGHDYVQHAADAGAAAAVVSESKLDSIDPIKMPLIVVDDVLASLRDLARAARARTDARIIAVTGSAGKTTTKSMLATLLSATGSVHAAERSFNNHWGVPLSLARMPRDCDFGVFEIGMNHAGEITPLTKLVRPHIAMVTLVAAAHLGAFDSLDGIADAKAEIFCGLEGGGTALINRDDERCEQLAASARAAGAENVLGYGASADAQFRIIEVHPGEEGSAVAVDLDGHAADFDLPVPGTHMVSNVVGALAAASLAGADLDKAIAATGQLRPEAGRGRAMVLGEGAAAVRLIDESYNANPASMAAALEVLAGTAPGPDGRRIAVLGDMLELGTASERLHRELEEPITRAGVDRLWLAGPLIAALAQQMERSAGRSCLAGHFATADALRAPLLADIRPGDVIMIKASNGLNFAALVDAIRDRFAPQGAARNAG